MSEVMIYCGQLTEATFLSSLLEANGIAARLASEAPSGHDEMGVYVANSDLARARPLIEDFEARGKKSATFWQRD